MAKKELNEDQKIAIAYHKRQIASLQYQIEQHQKSIEKIKNNPNYELK